MPGESTEVGSIVAYLRADKSDWHRTLAEARREADELQRHNPNLKINVDSAKGLAQLAALRSAMNSVTDAQVRIGKAQANLDKIRGSGGSQEKLAAAENDLARAMRQADQAGLRLAATHQRIAEANEKASTSARSESRSMGLLLTSVLALGPALVPLAAGVAGFGVGAAAATGVAILGFIGIKNAMKEGTTEGLKYRAAFAPIVDETEHLEKLSAAGLFTGINQGVRDARALFPELNRDTALWSTQLGHIVGNVAPGLVAFVQTLSPLLTDIGDDLVGGSAKFEQWAKSSDGLKRFVAYAQTELPVVEHVLSDTAGAISHIVVAAAPLGGVSLSSFGVLVHLIASLPLGVLQTAIPLITGVTLAVKALKAVNASELPISIGMRGMAGIAGIAGVALATLSSVFGQNQQDAMRAAQEVDAYTQALIRSKGAIDDQVRSQVVANLQAAGAYGSAQRLGLSIETVTKAALGNKDALGQVDGATRHLDFHSQILRQSISAQRSELHEASNAAKVHSLAIAAATDATKSGSAADKAKADALARVAGQYGASVGVYQQAAAAANSKRLADQQATLQMQLESDAAGLLKQALDILNGKELGVAQATTAYDSALLSLTKSLHDNGKTVAENTDKGVANRRAIEQSISAAQSQAQAVANATKSTQQGTAAYNRSGQAILDHIAKQNGDKTAADRARDATYQFAQQLLGLGRIKVPPTKVDIDKATADKKVRDFRNSLIQIAGYRPTTAVGANTAGALAKLKEIKDHLNDLNGSVANTYVNTYVSQINAANKRQAGSAHASGGQLTEGLNLINERGPELLFKQGNRVDVVTADRTKDILSGASGGAAHPAVSGDDMQAAILAELQALRAAVNAQPREADRLATVRARMGV